MLRIRRKLYRRKKRSKRSKGGWPGVGWAAPEVHSGLFVRTGLGLWVSREIQRVARSRHMSLAEWVRQALDSSRRQEPLGSAGKKLDSIRIAVQHEFPAAGVEEMLAEIEAGYGATGPRDSH